MSCSGPLDGHVEIHAHTKRYLKIYYTILYYTMSLQTVLGKYEKRNILKSTHAERSIANNKQYNKLAATNALQECAANAPKFERSGSFSIRGRLSKLISSITNSKESLNANEKEHELPFQFTRSRSLILPKRTSRRSLVEPQLEQLSEEVEKWSDLTLPASPRKNSMESTDSKAEETCISAAIVSPPIEIPRNSQQSLTSTPCLKSPNSISFDPHQNFKRLRSNTFISSFKSTFAGLTGEKKKEKLNPKWSASLQSLQAIDNMVSYENMSFIDYDKFNGYEKHLERQLSQISLMEANQDMQMPRPSDCNVITEDTSCTLLNAAVTPVCSTTSAVFVAPQTVIRRRQRISSHNTSSRALADRHSASRHSFHLDTDYEHNLDKPRNVYRDSLDSRKLEILNSLSRSSFILDSNIIDVLDLADGSLGKRKRGAYQTNKRREPGGVDVVDARQSKQVSEQNAN
uniref:Uncharacterized protein n=1 Tax=Glossina morsitans morsitans TaxID=37546 RepID=A0A1B0G908_GLOMM